MPHNRRIVAIAAVVLFFGSLLALSVHAAFDDSTAGTDAAAVGAAGAAGGGDTSSGNGTSGGDSSAASNGDTAGTGSAGTAGGTAGQTSSAGGSGATATPAGGTAATASGGGTAGARNTAPIPIGVHDEDTGSAASAYGVKGTGESQLPWIKKIVAWINANGGYGGRPVELVAHVTDAINGSFDQQAEEACVDFTEDHHVVAVVGGAKVPTLTLPDCLARHRTPLVWDYHFMADQAAFDRYADYLYMPTMVREERMGAWIDGVANAHFFDQGTLGLVRYDEPLHKRMADQIVRPRLAAHGLQVKDEVAFRPATGASSAADLAGQSNNAVLRFQSEGVNRVLFEPTAGVMPLLFMTAAESQHFRPRYTYTSYDIPGFQADNATANQLAGSLAFGWLPAGDTAQPQQPPLNPTAKLCVRLTNDVDPPANGNIRRYCDGLLFLKAVFDRGAEPTPAGIRRVVEAMGASWESPWTFKTVMSPARHDGATVARLVAYDTGCSCYAYSGGDLPIP